MKKWIIAGAAAFVGLGLVVSIPILYNNYQEKLAYEKLEAEYETFLDDTDVFFEKTIFNGIEIGGLTPDEAVEQIISEYEAEKIEIVTPFKEDNETFSYADLNTNYKNLTKEVYSAFENQYMSKEDYLNGTFLNELAYDIKGDAKLSKISLDRLKCNDPATRIPSENAYIEVDKITGNLVVREEVYGNILKKGVLEEKLLDAVKNGLEKIVLLPEDYELPSIVSTDNALVTEKNYYKTLLDKELTIDVCGTTVVLNKDKTEDLYDFEPGNEVDEDAVIKFVRSLKSKYDTYKKDRAFHTSTGEDVIVSGGNYGWAIKSDDTVKVITDALLSKKESEHISVKYAIEGVRPYDDEIGNTYVEISLRDQKIWMYVDGVMVVNDDCTTGMADDPEAATNVGTFRLTYKKTDCILRGPTWEDPVSYWMPFDGANGMHDATWRTDEEFGGTNRYGNGSHGCVNLRLNSAAIIYNNIQSDTPIITW